MATAIRFVARDELREHFYKHAEGYCDEFGGSYGTPEEYEQGAVEFLNRGPVGGIMERARIRDGWRIRFDPISDEFAICDTYGFVMTYYKPNPFEHGKGDNTKYFLKRCLQ